jgi:hypothetical protein
MMVVARMVLAAMMVHGTRGIGIAQDDRQLAVDWRQHEAGGNERPQAEHREHPGRCPTHCPVARAVPSHSHGGQHASQL